MKKNIEKPESLKDWQKMFANIYGEKNKRDYTSAELLLHIVEESAKVAEGLRKENNSEISDCLPQLFAWFFAFCNEMKIDLEKVVWHKYPGICPYCFKESNCMCITEEKKYHSPDELDNFRKQRNRVPLSLEDWQDMFRRIYGSINKTVWQKGVFLHFLEEIGEISKAFRLREKQNLQDEIADAFAWLMAFSNKLEFKLEDIIYKTYPGKCDVCRKEKCECPPV